MDEEVEEKSAYVRISVHRYRTRTTHHGRKKKGEQVVLSEEKKNNAQ